jgi:hypothetical protein
MDMTEMYEADRAKRKPGILTSLMIAQLRDAFPERRITHFDFQAPINFLGQSVVVAQIHFHSGFSFMYWSESRELWAPVPFPSGLKWELD